MAGPEPMLRVQVALPPAWAVDPTPWTPPPTPWLTMAGLTVEARWNGEHADDGARLVIYGLRGPDLALQRLEPSLARLAGAERVEGRLMWAAAGEDWLSFNVLQDAAEVGVRPLLWSSYLPAASARGRMREIVAALDDAGWSW